MCIWDKLCDFCFYSVRSPSEHSVCKIIRSGMFPHSNLVIVQEIKGRGLKVSKLYIIISIGMACIIINPYVLLLGSSNFKAVRSMNNRVVL